jgi:hypothetical protein
VAGKKGSRIRASLQPIFNGQPRVVILTVPQVAEKNFYDNIVVKFLDCVTVIVIA